jgi:hypothetical protein
MLRLRQLVISFPIVDPPARTIDGFSSEEFRKLLDLNLIGYFLACKVQPHLPTRICVEFPYKYIFQS